MDPGTRTVILSIVSTAVAGFVLALRCISRVIVTRNSGIDDVLAICAYLSSVATTCFIYVQYQHGLGQDLDTFTYAQLCQLLKYLWASVITFGVGMPLLSLSASIQYLRFLVQRKYRILCWISNGVTIVLGIPALIISIFTCQPIAFFWDKSIPGGKCIDLYLWWYFASGWIIIMSFLLVIIPIIAVKNLNLPTMSKLALVGVFALGGFDVVASILRLYFTYILSISPNITRDFSESHTWASLELNVGVICVSLPPLRALFSKVVSYATPIENGSSMEQINPPDSGTAQSPRPDSGCSTSIKTKSEYVITSIIQESPTK